MDIALDAQKSKFLELCKTQIKRPGMDALLDWMGNADFFTAPASTKYHGAYRGGLCQHSLDVYEQAKKLVFMLPEAPSEESLAITTLFHDVCKVNLYKEDKKNQKINGTWQ